MVRRRSRGDEDPIRLSPEWIRRRTKSLGVLGLLCVLGMVVLVAIGAGVLAYLQDKTKETLANVVDGAGDHPAGLPASGPPTTTASGLVVSAFTVEKLQQIDADLWDPADSSSRPMSSTKLEAPIIDVVIKNNSGETAVLSAVEFRFTYIAKLPSCNPVGGPIKITGFYDIKVPRDPMPVAPFIVERQLRHKIEKGDVERLAFSVGMDAFYEGDAPYLLRVDLVAKSDIAQGPVPLGSALVLSTHNPLDLYYRLDREAYPPDCPAGLLKQVNDFMALPGHKSPQLSELLSRVREFEKRWKP